MIEMHITPPVWRAMHRDDREYLLGIRRLMRREEGVEYDENKPVKPGVTPAGGAA